jgi:hypothetical protein
MSSIDHKLTKDETLIFCTKCHWAMLLGPMLVIIIGGLAVKSQGIHAVALMAFGFAWCVFSHISIDRSQLSLTEKRVLINAGFPMPRFYDIPLNDIVGIDFYQPALGSLLNFGKIWIVYEGRSRCSIRFVSSPALFVSEVRRRLSSLNRS